MALFSAKVESVGLEAHYFCVQFWKRSLVFGSNLLIQGQMCRVIYCSLFEFGRLGMEVETYRIAGLFIELCVNEFSYWKNFDCKFPCVQVLLTAKSKKEH